MASLNPSDANGLADMSAALSVVGRSEEAIKMIRHAMRLNPFHPDWYWDHLGIILYDAHRYEEALEAYKQLASRHKYWVHARMAACYGQLGRHNEARLETREVLRLKPDYRISKQKLVYKNSADAEHVIDGMRKAGLPA